MEGLLGLLGFRVGLGDPWTKAYQALNGAQRRSTALNGAQRGSTGVKRPSSKEPGHLSVAT